MVMMGEPTGVSERITLQLAVSLAPLLPLYHSTHRLSTDKIRHGVGKKAAKETAPWRR
ncbi:MAG: hypothetical protein IKC73_06270 [Clostridia bacterium]|nr:hypothetical protein [Clostridia bacterium]